MRPYTVPDKLAFKAPSGVEYSFDIQGSYMDREVFIESKGYSEGGSLLDQYREFIAKAYSTSVQYRRHSRDLFWFVTNVPFGCNTGAALTSPSFVSDALASPPAAALLGGAPVDIGHLYQL